MLACKEASSCELWNESGISVNTALLHKKDDFQWDTSVLLKRTPHYNSVLLSYNEYDTWAGFGEK